MVKLVASFIPTTCLLLSVLQLASECFAQSKDPASERTFPSQQPLVSKLSATNASEPRVLNVHVVSHTHDDVGWLKTVEQYYHGRNMTIQSACVREILDSVVSALLENPSRTFTYVEQKFFSMWWKRQNDAVRDSVRYLVANKQLSFVNGGWCMHDEAATHYMGMIDQTTLGHSFLKKELGVVPKVGWQLDPFGHSATQASLFASKVGFDALYFGRIDYQDLRLRQLEQECEGLWNSSKSLPDSTVFWGLTGSFRGNYGAPKGFCFDIVCRDPLLIDLNTTELLNSVHDLLRKIRIQSDQSKSNHIMLTMGSDFAYRRARVNFANLDIMIGTITQLQLWNKIDISAMFGPRFDRVNIFYSSPDYYTKCRHDEVTATRGTAGTVMTEKSPESLSVKYDDFFPYSDCEHCFWTGYFTSRTGLKRLERVSSAFLLAARQVESMPDYTGKPDSFKCHQAFDQLEDASGVAQHHDGVSGTSKQHVANDYAKRLQEGINNVSTCTARKMKRLLLGANASSYFKDFSFCQLLNETSCDVAERATKTNKTELYVTVYNSLSSVQSRVIRLPVATSGQYEVTKVGEQALPTTVEAFPVRSAEGGSCKKHVLSFSTGPLPPLGANVFRVVLQVNSSGRAQKRPKLSLSHHRDDTGRGLRQSSRDIPISNEFFTATFDRATGALKRMNTSLVDMPLTNTWGYYTSFDAKFDAPPHPNKDPTVREIQNSGAYIFRPSEAEQTLRTVKATAASFRESSVGTEVDVEYDVPWIKTTSRVLTGQPYLEIEYTVGPIPINDGRGKEVVSKLDSQIQSDGTFYTDSNGREFMERVRNYRPTWALNAYEPVAGNYYPVNAAIYVEDKAGRALAVATDRSQGGASLTDGSIELMVQRRTVVDDARGVSEPLNETKGGVTPYPPYGNASRVGDGVVIKGIHRVLIGSSGGATLARSVMDQAFADPLVFVGSVPAGVDPRFFSTSFSGLVEPLPSNVMLITRSLLYDEAVPTMLVRLAHQYAIDESDLHSKPVEVDLAKCLPGYEIVDVTEVTLSGNQNYNSWVENRLDWTGEGKKDTYASRAPVEDSKVEVHPMDIRSFKIRFK